MFEIGVDIGGTNIKYGLVNEALEIVAHGSIPFPKTTAEDMADKLAAALRAMLAEQGVTEIGSIGIVVPGSIDRSGEVVIAAYNLGFHDVPLRARRRCSSRWARALAGASFWMARCSTAA